MNKFLLRAIVTLASSGMFILAASAQSGVRIQESAPQQGRGLDLEESISFCMYELRSMDEGFDSLRVGAWSTVSRHLFHCHMLIRSELMLSRRYRSPGAGVPRPAAENGSAVDRS